MVIMWEYLTIPPERSLLLNLRIGSEKWELTELRVQLGLKALSSRSALFTILFHVSWECAFLYAHYFRFGGPSS